MSDALSKVHERIAEIKVAIAALDELRDEKARLERFCESAEFCLKSEAATSPSGLNLVALPDSIARRISPDDDRLWKAIHVVMGLRRVPMTAGEILAELEKQRVAMTGTNKRETVRSTMIRRNDQFQRVGRGIFALAEWPDEIKNMRNDEIDDDEGSAQSNTIPVTVNDKTVYVGTETDKLSILKM